MIMSCTNAKNLAPFIFFNYIMLSEGREGNDLCDAWQMAIGRQYPKNTHWARGPVCKISSSSHWNIKLVGDET